MSEPRGSRYQNQQGTASPANGSDVTKTIIAGVSGKKVYCTRAFLNVTLAAAGGGGIVKLRDGDSGTVFLQMDANSVASYQFDFGDTGYELTTGNGLQAEVSGAVTTQATVLVTALGYHR